MNQQNNKKCNCPTTGCNHPLLTPNPIEGEKKYFSGGYCLTGNIPAKVAPSNNWKERLKPKITSNYELNENVVDFAGNVLDTYWQRIKPEIEKLLASERHLAQQEIVERIKGELGSCAWCDLEDGRGEYLLKTDIVRILDLINKETL